jgi:hypothetical protein
MATGKQMTGGQAERRVWLLALGAFVLAGSTGVLLRAGLLHGFPGGLQFANVRHAHSHLMYFAWATPALMLLMAAWLPGQTGRPAGRGFRRTAAAAILLGLLSYPPFLLAGYGRLAVAGRELPLSGMLSGVQTLPWLAFALLYLRARRGVRGRQPLRLWDLALAFQLLAVTGAGLRSALAISGVRDPFWTAAGVHLFLDLFSDGWFVLALLGLLYAAYPAPTSRAASWATRLLAVGVPLLFALKMPPALVPGWLRAMGSVAGLLVTAGLALHVAVLWPRLPSRWRLPLAFLGLVAAGTAGLVLPPVATWAQAAGLRVSFLHWQLLGFVSLGLLLLAAEAQYVGSTTAWRTMAPAVVLLVASLLPLTGLWPAAWAGRWAMVLAAWAALAPVLAALAIVVQSVTALRRWQPGDAPEEARSAPPPSGSSPASETC